MTLTLVSDGAADAPAVFHVQPWPDPVLDEQGHDPRGEYADQFWVPLLGPTASLLARRLVTGLERAPAGFELPTEETARMLGLGARGGRRSPFARTVGRLGQFRVAHLDPAGGLLVRRRLPGLTRTQVARLPAPLRAAHDDWRSQVERSPGAPVLRERARTLALTLLQLGEPPEDVEAHLRRLRFHPTLAADALAYAQSRLPQDLILP
jgi:hypothetical protein